MVNQTTKNGIKKARENAKLSELELANRLNVDLAVVNAWEIGEGIILLSTLEKMSKILNASFEMLLYGEEKNQ